MHEVILCKPLVVKRENVCWLRRHDHGCFTNASSVSCRIRLFGRCQSLMRKPFVRCCRRFLSGSRIRIMTGLVLSSRLPSSVLISSCSLHSIFPFRICSSFELAAQLLSHFAGRDVLFWVITGVNVVKTVQVPHSLIPS